jgi:flagellar basal-body rod modification protein FlgD
MSTVGGVTGQSGTNSATTTDPTATSATNPLADEETFLKLLVSQLQNQDPMNPTDTNQFVSQLTSYSQLEQLIGIHTDTTSLSGDVTGTSSQTSSNSNSGSTTPTSGN